jgi:putative endonuclease
MTQLTTANVPAKTTSEKGIELVLLYLKGNEFVILEQNYKCAAGKCDIIGFDSDTLVFIRVVTRNSLISGMPEPTGINAQRATYEKIAMHYLCDNPVKSCQVRFDVISATTLGSGRGFVRHHRDAFGVGD